MAKNPKRPRDPNQLAKMIVDLATGETFEQLKKDKDPSAAALGRKGGDARAKNLSPDARKSIAKKAAAKRWEKKGNTPSKT